MTIKFSQKLHVLPTNKAIYQALICVQEKPNETFTKRLLSEPESSILNESYLYSWLQVNEPKAAVSKFNELRNLGLIKGSESQSKISNIASDEAINICLNKFSEVACMLANDQGFHLANVGFSKEIADELAVVAAELHSFHHKRVKRIVVEGVARSDVWSILGQDSSSGLSFRPIHTDHQNFILIIKGSPNFNNSGLLDLARILMNKYNQ